MQHGYCASINRKSALEHRKKRLRRAPSKSFTARINISTILTTPMSIISIETIILAVCAAAAAGLVGAFALMRRTILAGDVMSHIAIPGLGLAIIWNLNPFVGGGLTLFAGILIIWQ